MKSVRWLHFIMIISLIEGAGCTNSQRPLLKSAFQDLTSETQQPRGPLLQHNEIMSVTGMIPQVAPGTLVHFSDPNDSTTAIGINPDTQSHYLTCTFDGEEAQAALPDMLLVRSAVRTYQNSQLNLLVAMDTAMTQAVSRMAMVENPDSSEGKARIQKAMSDLFEASAQGHEEFRKKIFEEESALIQTVHKPNLLVTQWSSAVDVGAQLNAESLGDASTRSRTTVDGYWILSGLRMQFLVIGADIAKFGDSGGKEPHEIDPEVRRLLRAISVTTFAMQSRASLWVSESSELAAMRSKVAAKVDDLESVAGLLGSPVLASKLIQQLRIDVELSAARRSNLSNIGVLQRPKWEMIKHEWKVKAGSPNGSDGWMTIMAQSACMGSAADQLLPIVSKICAATSKPDEAKNSADPIAGESALDTPKSGKGGG